MSEAKVLTEKQIQYSSKYIAIKKEVEKWPAWKVTVYNTSVATSLHAKKIEQKSMQRVSTIVR